MSKKRNMTKRQRLYYEYTNRDRIKRELAEYYQSIKEIQDKYTIYFNRETLL